MNKFVRLQWSDIPLAYEGPRFGVVETPASTTTRRSRWALQVAEPLQVEPAHIQEWVLWREAILEHLPPHVRQVPEAADIGLYAGLKHGITDPTHRKQLQRLWEKLSPLREYEYYRYYPTMGFAYYDKVVDGTFLQKTIPWLQTIRGGKHAPLSSATYTATLEKMMLETERKLTKAEVRFLKVLTSNPSLSQKQLAKQLKITPGSLSIVINRLASKHLLRVYCQLNVPQIGLQHIVLLFNISRFETHQKLKQKLAKVKYAVVTRSIDSSLLIATFYIPSNNFEDFRSWVNKLCRSWELYLPQINEVADVMVTGNFQNYTPNAGWPRDFTSILELIGHIVRERAARIAPPFHSFKYSYPDPTGERSSLKLCPEDFMFFQRSTDSITVTDTASSRISREARQLGLSKSEERQYDSRVRKLSRLGVQSDPFGIGLIHTGLNATLDIYLRSSREITELVLRGLQLLPHLSSVVFKTGNAVARLSLPNAVAVETFSFLRTLFAECGIYAQIGVKPAWRAFDYTSSPINPKNYDFEKGAWIWDPVITPEL